MLGVIRGVMYSAGPWYGGGMRSPAYAGAWTYRRRPLPRCAGAPATAVVPPAAPVFF